MSEFYRYLKDPRIRLAAAALAGTAVLGPTVSACTSSHTPEASVCSGGFYSSESYPVPNTPDNVTRILEITGHVSANAQTVAAADTWLQQPVVDLAKNVSNVSGGFHISGTAVRLAPTVGNFEMGQPDLDRLAGVITAGLQAQKFEGDLGADQGITYVDKNMPSGNLASITVEGDSGCPADVPQPLPARSYSPTARASS